MSDAWCYLLWGYLILRTVGDLMQIRWYRREVRKAKEDLSAMKTQAEQEKRE